MNQRLVRVSERFKRTVVICVQAASSGAAIPLLRSTSPMARSDSAAAGPFARGGRVGQRVEFAAASGPSRTTLHDLQVTAELPVGASIVPGSVRVFAGEAPVAFRDTSSGSRLALAIDALPPGGLIRVAYDLDLAGDLTPGSSVVVW